MKKKWEKINSYHSIETKESNEMKKKMYLFIQVVYLKIKKATIITYKLEIKIFVFVITIASFCMD